MPSSTAPENRPPQRARRWVARAAIGLVVAVAGAGVGTGATMVATAAPPPIAIGEDVLDVGVAGEAADVDWPAGVDAAAFEVGGLTGASGAAGAQGALPIASVAKLVTMLVVLDEQPLGPGEQGPTLTMTEQDLAMRAAAAARGAAVMPMAVGQQLTQRQLMDAAMLQSSANAATTLAQWAFGSQEAYVAAATAWLDEQGLDGIVVTDATGLSRRNAATASDLLALMDAVDASPVLREVTGQREADVPGLGVVANTNGSVGIAGIDAGKTGSLNRSGRTVLVGATTTVAGTELRIHAALLGVQGGVDRDAAITALVASVAEHVVEREVVAEGAPIAAYEAPWGPVLTLHAKDALTVVTWRETPIDAIVDVPGQVVVGSPADGTITVEASGETIDVRVGTHDELAPPDWTWRLAHATEVWGWAVGSA